MEFRDQFERDFMRRTLELVKKYEGPYDATLLLNCLLGLLIVPKETSIDRIPPDPLSALQKWGISPTSIRKPGKKTKKNSEPETLRGIVWNLRNAVAHFRFIPLHGAGMVSGFEFTDQSGFHAVINVDEMKVFVEKLSRYLENQYVG